MIVREVAVEAIFSLLIVFCFQEMTTPGKYHAPKLLYGAVLALTAATLAWLKKDSVLILLAGIVTPEVYQSLLTLKREEFKDRSSWIWVFFISLLWLAILSLGLYGLRTKG